jgi:hypothetical protein
VSRPAAAAALALLLAGGAGCCRFRNSPEFAVQPVQPGPAQAPIAISLRALHFGDIGDTTCQQKAVSAAMAHANARAPFDLALSAGDNVYEEGPDESLAGAAGCAFLPDGNTVAPGWAPPDDPLFRKHFEGAMEGLVHGGAPVPVYLVLGNHDVDSGPDFDSRGPPSAAGISRRKACLEVAHRSPRWSMPGRHYVVDKGPARFIAIDSNLLLREYGGFALDDEVKFVEAAAQGCADRICFVLAHHPPVTAGDHVGDATPEYLARLGRIEAAAKGRVRAWLVGHDHDLQHLRAPGGYEVLVSGNASRGRKRERFEQVSVPGGRLLFASTAWGYGRLDVGDGGWGYRFENVRGEPMYCCEARGAGPCEPVVCAK